MSKKSCEAAESVEDAVLRMARVNSNHFMFAKIIRNPLIYCVNRYFLMFGGSQVQKSYRAGTNDFLIF